MKIRQGFVSNSSSSSFLVNFRSFDLGSEQKEVLTPEKQKILIDYGFFYTRVSNPSYFDTLAWLYLIGGEKSTIECPKHDFFCSQLGHAVICNQHQVYEFLIEQDIPFVAMEHSQTKVVIRDKRDMGHIVVIPNVGSLIANDHRFEDECIADREDEVEQKFTFHAVKQFLKEHY